MLLYDSILKLREGNKKTVALLLDPDKCQNLVELLELANGSGISMVLVGGSVVEADTNAFVAQVKAATSLPVVLFPGDVSQFTPAADAILLLSLISGRNPEYLIGSHVAVAPALKRSKMEVLPTGYILIDGGRVTSVQYVSQTLPIPADKVDIAVATAIAGEQLGMKLIYLEAGSGAINPVPQRLIAAVRSQIDIPIIVGGGIRSVEQLNAAFAAGADVVVIGNAIEQNPELLKDI